MAPPTPGKKRLAVCLDGTWNKAQSGTNIYHLSNLIFEGDLEDPTDPFSRQEIYYSEGVGTHAFDSVTGGAFGAGLSDIVREAYDWLVERYNDGDEIYVFGFSRGAFAARSLVGLISKCGLLLRGAPIPPEELWTGYQILGRHRNSHTGALPSANWSELILGRPRPPFRPIWMFIPDTWATTPPAKLSPPLNHTERLLAVWSRRVDITCVGVFDTVGSMGVDAFAIPGLRSKAAQFHDTNLSDLCLNAFHAMAIDEYRANFVCIPWRVPVDPPTGARDRAPGAVEQRWFVGAHSNLGGGYEDDLLAQLPLKWMMEQCTKVGLQFKPFANHVPLPVTGSAIPRDWTPLTARFLGIGTLDKSFALLRDSFGEFGMHLWKFLIRSKPEYRVMGQLPAWENGVVVQTLNETIDQSVVPLRNWNNAGPGPADEPTDPKAWPLYNPPHIYDWAMRQSGNTVLQDYLVGVTKPKLAYFGWNWATALLALWIAACGFGTYQLTCMMFRIPLVLAFAAGFAALLVDWTEARINFELALAQPGRRAGLLTVFLNLFLIIRLAALAVIGAGVFYLFLPLPHWIPLCWQSDGAALGLMEFLFLFLSFGKEWCGSSMLDAGLESIVALQKCSSPEQVAAQLKKWTKDDTSVDLLQPVVEAIGRDILGLVPTYTAVLLCGVKFLSWTLIAHEGIASWFGPYAAVIGTTIGTWGYWLVAATAAANLIEDLMMLIWIKGYRCAKTPLVSCPGVALSTVCFGVKILGFSVGLVLAIFSIISLYGASLASLNVPWGLGTVLALLVSLPLISSVFVWGRQANEKRSMAEEAPGRIAPPRS